MMDYASISATISADLANWESSGPNPYPSPKSDETVTFLVQVGMRIYRPWVKDRLDFAFDNPRSFAATPKLNTSLVFIKLLTHLRQANTRMSDDHLIILVNKFTEACTEDEWVGLYQPILRRIPFPDITTQDFNSWLAYVVHVDPIRPTIPLSRISTGLPQGPGMLYPITSEATIMVFAIWRDSITAYEIDFTEEGISSKLKMVNDDHMDLLWPLLERDDMDYPLVIDAITYPIPVRDPDSQHPSFTLIGFVDLVDVVPLSQASTWPGAFRRERLEEVFSNLLGNEKSLNLADGYPITIQSDIDKARAHFASANPEASVHSGLFVANDRTFTRSTMIVPLFKVGT